MNNPYEKLPEKAFWKLAVANRNMFDISEMWDPKFHIKRNQRVVTFGSCFAQYIGQSLQGRGFRWLRTERPPYGLSKEGRKKYNYDIFSARTGNIYTATLLEQWTKWALGHAEVSSEVWEREGRFYDPFRPQIEPGGFESPEEISKSLRQTAECFKASIEKADYFVFTLGLTESWVNKNSHVEYPTCPGTVAGRFDPQAHAFVNLEFSQIFTALSNSMALMRERNKNLKFILTVSPVPLTATCSDNHVLVATMASKSVLRAVAGQLSANCGYVDYFPSFEVINSPAFNGIFFEANKRSVNRFGVDFVMDSFFENLEKKYGKYPPLERGYGQTKDLAGAVCEEELLEAFAK